MESFKEFVKKTLNEMGKSEDDESPIFKNDRGQTIYITDHFFRRWYRAWWDNPQDTSFSFIKNKDRKIMVYLNIFLNHVFKRKPSELVYRETWAVVSKDVKRALVFSLRWTKATSKNDSGTIVTILNADAKDAHNKDKVIFNNQQPPERQIHLHNSEFDDNKSKKKGNPLKESLSVLLTEEIDGESFLITDEHGKVKIIEFV